MRPHARAPRSPRLPWVAVLIAAACAGAPQPSLQTAERTPAALLEPELDVEPLEVPEETPAEPAAQDPGELESGVLDASATRVEVLRRDGMAAFERGDYAAVREALDQLQAGPLLDLARTSLLSDDLDGAIAASGEARAMARTHAGAGYLYGVCLAERAQRTGEVRALEEALQVLLDAPRSRAALYAASRVARTLGETGQALDLARHAGTLRGVDPAEDLVRLSPWSPEPSERTLAEAALGAWREAGGADDPGARPLFAEAEAALEQRVALAPDDLETWRRLGEAHLEARRPARARATLRRALVHAPEERGLVDMYARAAREDGGLAGLIAGFEVLRVERPETALYWWVPAEALFVRALEGGPGTRNRFLAAGDSFRACRERDSTLRAECLRYEALCRTGQGWSWLGQGDLDRAWAFFQASGEVYEGGLEATYEDRLASAADGLRAVVEGLVARERVREAAPLAERLHLRAKDDASLALLAGRLNREQGDREQLLSLDYALASRGMLDDAARLAFLREDCGIEPTLWNTGRESDIFERAGKDRAQKARVSYATAFRAFRHQVNLEPENLQARCEAATLAIKRLGEALNWSEKSLLRCVELGEARLAQDAPEGEARLALQEVVGDACQLLGILYLEHRAAPRRARAWFEKCLAVDPVPRADVVDHYLPRCDAR